MSDSPSAKMLSLAPRAFPKHTFVHRIATSGSHLFHALLRTTRVAPVALLIDGDNIACDLVGPMLIEAGKFGGVVIRRVYGNWSQPSMQRWKEVSQFYSLQQMHHVEVNAYQKNATDIALVVDAMDLLYKEHIDHFCIVTSDSDYTPLAERLRSEGCFVLGIGRSTTSPSFSRACTTFLTTEQLRPPMSQPRPVTTAPSLIDVEQPGAGEQTVQVIQSIQATNPTDDEAFIENESSPEVELVHYQMLRTQQDRAIAAPFAFPAIQMQPGKEVLDLLIDSYRAAKRFDTDWVLVAKLGLEIHKRKPDFNSNDYGLRDLSSLIRLYDTVFEIRKRSTGHPEIRMIS